MMEFDNDIAPIVGQQVTLNKNTQPQADARITLLEQRAKTVFVSKLLGGQVTECDLIALGIVDGQKRGYLFDSNASEYRSDSAADARLSREQLTNLAIANDNSLTFTCALPGKGWRLALDNNLNGILNADESVR